MTVADLSAVVCPLPVHWNVKVVSAYRASVRPVPGLGDVPNGFDALDHGPPAVQLEALVELQESVERSPYETEVGETDMEAVGAGLASEQEAEEPLLRPAQVHVQELAPSTLETLVPAEQE